MTSNRKYRPARHTCAPHLCDAVGTMPPHTYGVRPRSYPAISTGPCRPTACVRECPCSPGGEGHRPAAGRAQWAIQHMSHTDYQPITNYKLLITHCYTFSAKEKDSETGLSYFGSRYYSSDLSIWLSVDPMSDKYPSLSPYTYCADNPVKLVDPNGEAFDTEIDEANQTITIHAVYYTTKKDAVPLKKELEAWKKKGESFCYISEGKEYSVHFNLEIRDFDDVDKAIDEFGKNKDDGVSNYFQINKTVENPKHESVNGINYEGNNMYVTKGQIRSIRHEIGHSLGLGDWDHGLMKSGGAIYGISKNNIISIFENAGIRSQIHNFWGDWGNRQTDPICTSKTTYNKLGLFKRKHNH